MSEHKQLDENIQFAMKYLKLGDGQSGMFGNDRTPFENIQIYENIKFGIRNLIFENGQ